MNFKFNLIFVAFVINLSNRCSNGWEWPDPFKRIDPIHRVTYSRSETSEMSPKDLFNLHHAFTFESNKWDDGQVNYVIDKNFDASEREKISRAMAEIQNSSCIRYELFNNETHSHYVSIQKDYNRKYIAKAQQGCKRKGKQFVWFGSKILAKDSNYCTILHEFLHTLGFQHHHKRSDRDQHIEFHMENTNLDETRIAVNFEKEVAPDPEVKFLTPFDVDSVMLYDTYAGSKNCERVITSKVEGVEVTDKIDKHGLSTSDKVLINDFYNCPRAKKIETSS